MAAFQLAFSATQSANGKVVTIIDQSNWGNNTEGYNQSDFVLEFILTDALDAAIITIDLTTGIFVVTYDVPAKTNPWINIDFNAVGPVTIDVIQKYAFQRNFELAYIAAGKGNCGCGTIKHIDLCQVDTLYQIAQYAVPIDDAPDYQNNIDSAYKLLTA